MLSTDESKRNWTKTHILHSVKWLGRYSGGSITQCKPLYISGLYDTYFYYSKEENSECPVQKSITQSPNPILCSFSWVLLKVPTTTSLLRCRQELKRTNVNSTLLNCWLATTTWLRLRIANDEKCWRKASNKIDDGNGCKDIAESESGRLSISTRTVESSRSWPPSTPSFVHLTRSHIFVYHQKTLLIGRFSPPDWCIWKISFTMLHSKQRQ